MIPLDFITEWRQSVPWDAARYAQEELLGRMPDEPWKGAVVEE